jgi:predicted membrane metal-binding protein
MNNNKIKLGSNRSFGIVFFIVFLIIATYPLLNDNSIRLWSLVIGIIFLILGIINSKVLTPLNILWMKFGLLLGKIVSPVVMGFVFFGVITPISIMMKLLRKDLLNLKRNKKKTYWLKREEIKSNMKNQF